MRTLIKKGVRFSVTVFCALWLGGCVGAFLSEREGENAFIDDLHFAPKPFGMGRPDPRAPQEYLQGWNDGCKTGMAASGSGAYKAFYKYTVTAHLYSNKKYYRAWKDAYTYCRQYTQKWTLDPFDRVYENWGKLCILCPS